MTLERALKQSVAMARSERRVLLFLLGCAGAAWLLEWIAVAKIAAMLWGLVLMPALFEHYNVWWIRREIARKAGGAS